MCDAIFARPFIQDKRCFTVQPVSGPIGGNVSAVAPDRPNFLPADRLPDTLSVLYSVVVENDAAIFTDNFFRNRRRIVDRLVTEPTQYCKGCHQHDAERYPEFLVLHFR